VRRLFVFQNAKGNTYDHPITGGIQMEINITIEQAKREFFALIQRVSADKARVVLTSQGKPVAALVSMADYETLPPAQTPEQVRLKTWMQTTQALSEEIQAKQGGVLVDADAILDENRQDLEGQNDQIPPHD
jgi:prevent-host-death family protein